MRYVRLETSGQETRWINLDQVCRVTRGIESTGIPFIAVMFADGDVEDCFKVRGTDETNQQAINKLSSALDMLSDVTALTPD